ncbi:hypothetical protein AX16_008920 [Volvariella volvacea WC 439]|nr:hypothetical protein AX16_008920 [Volvariella volvacea WC 439]
MSVLFYEPFYDLERFFDDWITRPDTGGGQIQRRQANIGEGGGAVRSLKPRMDLHEDMEKNCVTATFELPGLGKDQVSINVQNGRLTVSGESKMSDDCKQGQWAVRERRYGPFSRTLQLPPGVKEDQIKAQMNNGVLCVTFPKTSPEAAPKKITVA